MKNANDYRILSEEQAAKWALTIDVEDFPRDVNDAEAKYIADLLEDLWFKDMKANRPHVLARASSDAAAIAGFRAMCRAALKARVLARGSVS
jgi:hypothetical protein